MAETEQLVRMGLVNNEAEDTVLGTMLGNEEIAAALITQSNEKDFYDQRKQIVFIAIRNLLNSIEPLDKGNVLAECRKVAVELNKKSPIKITAEFLDTLRNDKSKAVPYALTIHRLAWLREAADYATWIVKQLQLNPDPNELYAEAQERWHLMSPEKKQGATLYGWDTLKFTKDLIRRRQLEADLGLSKRFNWPWASWNRHVRPARPGNLAIITAADGVGKSTYLEWISEYWAQIGNKTVLVHLEDDHEYKLDRRLSRYSKIPLDIIEDEMFTREQQVAIDQAEQEMSEWAGNLHYTHAPGWTMSEILAEVKKLKDEGQCDCLVIDYIDKCAADRRQLQLYGSNQYLREGDNVEQLKNFAEKNGIPVVTATQGNKGMQDETKVRTRKDIDGSGKKSQRAQLVIILTRDMVGDGGLWDNGVQIAKKDEYSPIVNVRIDKQNRGKQLTFHQILRGECYRIGDLPIDFDLSKMKK